MLDWLNLGAAGLENSIYICGMVRLNFPAYSFRFKNSENKIAVFDEIRKRFVALTPEEWVRIHTVRYLVETLGYPRSMINVEKLLKVSGLNKRYDVVVFNPDGSIHILVECKAPEVRISQNTFDQIARYNMVAKASFLMVTNGLNHFYCTMDYKTERYEFQPSLPVYSSNHISAQPGS